VQGFNLFNKAYIYVLVQKFQGIGSKEFDELYDILSDSRVRYFYNLGCSIFISTSHHHLRFDFDAHLKTLTIRMPGFTHEEGVQEFYLCLADSMQRQRKACGRKLPWLLGANLESCLEVGGGSRAIQSKFIADVTIHNKYNAPLVIVEVDFSQAYNDVLEKVDRRMATIPSLLGAIIININELRAYSSPTNPPSPSDYIDESTWDSVVERAPAFGPIMHQGHCWVESIDCSFDIRFKGEAELRVEQAVRMSTLMIYCDLTS
jgi:hypothetical protein